MSQDWFSLKELSGLDGLPKTVQGVLAKAKREQWKSRQRSGYGGGNEYHINSLPAATKAALLDKAIATLPDTVCNLPAVKEKYDVIVSEDLPKPASLPKWRRDTMDARCQILHLVDQLAEQFGVSQAVAKVVARAKTGTLPEHIQELIPVANARSGSGQQTLSRTSLFRWRKLREIGTTALAPVEPPRQAIPAWAPYFLKCYQKPQKVSIQDALDELKLVIPAGIDIPSYSQANRFLKKMSVVDRERGRRSTKELKAIQPFRRRSNDDLQPLDIVQCDGHSFKARVAHPATGSAFHPEVCACIDTATRVVLGWSVGLSESAQTVADALRHAIMTGPGNERGGIPAIFYTDPGSGNIAEVNANPVFGRYARMGITFKTGIPGNSQARGLVERMQQTLWISAAKQLETFTGKGMDGSTERKNYLVVMKDIKQTGKSDKLISWPQFRDFCQQAVERYNNKPHSGLPKITDAAGMRRHMTPFEAWDWFVANGWQPETLLPGEIEDMFRPRKQVTTRRGEVTLFKNIYFNKDLQHYHGQKVFVEYEPQDGSFVYVRDLNEKLICKAEFNANKTSFYPVSALEESRNQRADRRLKLKQMQIEEIELERRGVVDIVSVDMEKIAQVKQQLIEEDKAHKESRKVDLPIDRAGRIRFYRNLKKRLENCEDIEPEELNWLETFKTTKAYQTMVEIDKDALALVEAK